MYKKHNSLLDHQEEREVLLKLLSDRKDFLEWLTHFYRQNQIMEPEYLSSYFNLDRKRPIYSEEKQPNENDNHFSKNLGYGKIFDVNRDPMESTLDSFQKKYIDEIETFHHEGGMEAAPIRPATAAASGATEPEFTYKFDDSNFKEKHPFAVKPNDPRYYSEESFSSGEHSFVPLISLGFFRVMLLILMPITLKRIQDLLNLFIFIYQHTIFHISLKN